MSYESGGRADKFGNQFEVRWVIHQLLKILEEKIDYIIFEPVGDDEHGTDVLIGKKDDTTESQQCKGRNGSKETWNFGSVNAKGIFKNWKYQLDRDPSNTVSLVSPLAFTNLEDLVKRAKTSENPLDFYKSQILNSNKRLTTFFEKFCKVMNLNPEKEPELVQCVSYLRRILYRQSPDMELKEIILKQINYLFSGNEERTYAYFVSWIIDGNIYGKKITQNKITGFLQEKNINFRNLALDNRIAPKINELNREYIDDFYCIDNKLIDREEFNQCKKIINCEKSLIIHGKAGRGKSGCTLSIAKYCKDKRIPYAAIKLDRRMPNGSAEEWGKQMGLPSSIVHCLHSISKNEKAVLILDQLDALRWTQSHSRDALLVCNELISQAIQLNVERKHKISVVFVCRTYDLENDNNISSLFNRYGSETKLEWCKVKVSAFTDDTVRSVVGNSYSSLTSKLQNIIKIPSNLFIWQRLSKKENFEECSSAENLISKWWEQLTEQCTDYGLNATAMENTKDEIVDWLEKNGRTAFPKNLITNSSYLDFLSSSEFLIVQRNSVSFAHQSILDNFLADNMLEKYFESKSVVEIISSKDKQTPGKRYQVQMFMNKLLSYATQDFIYMGEKLFESKNVRYFIKFIFFEILNQIESVNTIISTFILDKCKDDVWSGYIINNVIYAKPQYVEILRKNGFLDKWFDIPEKKKIVFNLLISISPNYSIGDIEFIKAHAFISKQDDELFAKCFSYDITQDKDEFFELRLKFYRKYPEFINNSFDLKSALKADEIRAVKVLSLLLKLRSKNISVYEGAFLLDDSEFFIDKGLEIVEILLPCIPTKQDVILHYPDLMRNNVYEGVLKTCIQLIKKANERIISSNPQTFLERYSQYIDTESLLFNEIILDGFSHMPKEFSDKIIDYLANNIGNKIISNTKNSNDKLALVKKVLAIHTKHCKLSTYQQLEFQIIHYTSPDAKDILTRRINSDKRQDNSSLYLSFWGDLQFELLKELPKERLSKSARELLFVLSRKFSNGTTKYRIMSNYAGWVRSSVSEKDLNSQQWLQIVTNKKLNQLKKSVYIKKDHGLVENSLEQFSNSFEYAVSKRPIEFIKLVLSNRNNILKSFVSSWLRGIEKSNAIKSISSELLEKALLCFPYDSKSQNARYFIEIVEKRSDISWSPRIINILTDIATNFKDTKLENNVIATEVDKKIGSVEMLQINAINCIRGEALQAIGTILKEHSSFFETFKDTIEKASLDKNPVVEFAAFYCLWPSLNIDKKWTEKLILMLFEKDIRLAGFYKTRSMFFCLYPKYRQQILKIIEKCFLSNDRQLIQIGAMSVSEMFIINHEFSDIMSNFSIISEQQAQGILDAALFYFNKRKYNLSVKGIILRLKKSNFNIGNSISRLFNDNLVDLNRDKDFLIKIVSFNLGYRFIYSFMKYIENNSKSIVDFQEIILSMASNIIQNSNKNARGVEDEISMLIIGLYDETCGSSSPKMKVIANKCLSLWDLMYKNQIGSIRSLSKKLMDR